MEGSDLIGALSLFGTDEFDCYLVRHRSRSLLALRISTDLGEALLPGEELVHELELELAGKGAFGTTGHRS